MSEFEKQPPRTRLERLVSALSIRTTTIKSAGGGGRPALESCHYAGMLAGMKGDPWLVRTAEHLLLHVYLREPDHRRPLGKALFLHLANRVLMQHPDLQTSGKELREIVDLTIAAAVAGGRVTYSDAERHGIKRKRWDRLRPVYHLALDRIIEAENALIEHLSRACT